MVRRSWLDGMIENFQHRWETNPQYRATMSGILGVVFLVFMCSCVGVVSAGANVALTSLGFGGGASSGVIDTNTGSRAVHSAGEIPIATVVLGPQQAIPETTLPSSGTPLPTATPSPTATATATPIPCTSNCGGGGGGGGCQGCQVSASGTPTPWVRGAPGYVSVHTSQPYVGINILVNYSNGCSSQLNGGASQTNSSGDLLWPVQGGAVNSCASSTASITVMAGFNGGADTKTITVSQPVTG